MRRSGRVTLKVLAGLAGLALLGGCSNSGPVPASRPDSATTNQQMQERYKAYSQQRPPGAGMRPGSMPPGGMRPGGMGGPPSGSQ
jgi:hypothetical protein